MDPYLEGQEDEKDGAPWRFYRTTAAQEQYARGRREWTEFMKGLDEMFSETTTDGGEHNAT